MSCLSVVLYVGASTADTIANATWDLIRIVFFYFILFLFLYLMVVFDCFSLTEPYTKRNNLIQSKII